MELATWKKESFKRAPLRNEKYLFKGETSEGFKRHLVHVVRSGGVFEEALVAEVVDGTNHPVAGPVQRVPSVRHVDVGVRPVVRVEQAPEIVGHR